MLNTTVSFLKCSRIQKKNRPCAGELELHPAKTAPGPSPRLFEVSSGQLQCRKCRAKFPILAGVAVLVDDVGFYLTSHVKGISQLVPDSEIPGEFLTDYLAAKEQLEIEHIDEDLESERVNALYFINHYLTTGARPGDPLPAWWRPLYGEGSPLVDSLIREHWDQGPFAQIERWVNELAQVPPTTEMVELGCGLGGLLPRLKKHIKTYLGVDSSFASIALARHLTLGTPCKMEIRIPEDLLLGPVSRKVKLPPPAPWDGTADFVVGDLNELPVQDNRWDLSVALNAIDMLENPATLPEAQRALLRKDGMAIQSCPYIWHPRVAKSLKGRLPGSIRRSSEAVEYLYTNAGFEIEKRVEHLPWLFFKHLRQLEIYSVHLFTARAR